MYMIYPYEGIVTRLDNLYLYVGSLIGIIVLFAKVYNYHI